MKRRIIKINEALCDGCGLCAEACHERAIGIENGKARLLRDDYCDGLGDCLPSCPAGAISFEEREALPYDDAAVRANIVACGQAESDEQALPCGCPGTQSRAIRRDHSAEPSMPQTAVPGAARSELSQWPVQIKLVPVRAPYFDGANLLIAADCTAYAYADFHGRFIKNRITLVGCPKLDDVDYTEKLTAILRENDIRSVMIVRMEVPCCAGLAQAATEALRLCGRMIPWQVAVISTDGRILDA